MAVPQGFICPIAMAGTSLVILLVWCLSHWLKTRHEDARVPYIGSQEILDDIREPREPVPAPPQVSSDTTPTPAGSKKPRRGVSRTEMREKLDEQTNEIDTLKSSIKESSQVLAKKDEELLRLKVKHQHDLDLHWNTHKITNTAKSARIEYLEARNANLEVNFNAVVEKEVQKLIERDEWKLRKEAADMKDRHVAAMLKYLRISLEEDCQVAEDFKRLKRQHKLTIRKLRTTYKNMTAAQKELSDCIERHHQAAIRELEKKHRQVICDLEETHSETLARKEVDHIEEIQTRSKDQEKFLKSRLFSAHEDHHNQMVQHEEIFQQWVREALAEKEEYTRCNFAFFEEHIKMQAEVKKEGIEHQREILGLYRAITRDFEDVIDGGGEKEKARARLEVWDGKKRELELALKKEKSGE